MFATVFQTLKPLGIELSRYKEISASRAIRLQAVLLCSFLLSVNKTRIHVRFSVVVCIFRRERSTDQEYRYSSLIRLTIESEKSSSLSFTRVAWRYVVFRNRLAVVWGMTITHSGDFTGFTARDGDWGRRGEGRWGEDIVEWIRTIYITPGITCQQGNATNPFTSISY